MDTEQAVIAILGTAVTTILGGFLWIVRKHLPSLTASNDRLVDRFIQEMENNRRALAEEGSANRQALEHIITQFSEDMSDVVKALGILNGSVTSTEKAVERLERKIDALKGG